MSGADLDCAFAHADARVHAIARSSDKPEALCGSDRLTVHVDAPFQPDDELACAGCAEAADRRLVSGSSRAMAASTGSTRRSGMQRVQVLGELVDEPGPVLGRNGRTYDELADP